MRVGSIIRNVLILGGIAGGVALGVHGGMQPVPQPAGAATGADGTQVGQAPSPIVLNTATPPDVPRLPLSKPLSLESTFGRSELTGVKVSRVPSNPLNELSFERRWDVVLAMKPPKPGADVAPNAATDEVTEPKRSEATVEATYNFKGLPQDAQNRAQAGLKALRDGTDLLREGEQQFRNQGREGLEGRQKIRDAALILRDAISNFEAALRAAPTNRDLLNLMQESKANLYFCMKHGM
jgi:hypothetical protein